MPAVIPLSKSKYKKQTFFNGYSVGVKRNYSNTSKEWLRIAGVHPQYAAMLLKVICQERAKRENHLSPT